MKNKEKFKEIFGLEVEDAYEDFWEEEYEPIISEPVRAYPCDPKKNKDCKKTACYAKGGPCSLTLNPEYAKED